MSQGSTHGRIILTELQTPTHTSAIKLSSTFYKLNVDTSLDSRKDTSNDVEITYLTRCIQLTFKNTNYPEETTFIYLFIYFILFYLFIFF